MVYTLISVENNYCCENPSYICYKIPKKEISKRIKKILRKYTDNMNDINQNIEINEFLKKYNYRIVLKYIYNNSTYKLTRILC